MFYILANMLICCFAELDVKIGLSWLCGKYEATGGSQLA